MKYVRVEDYFKEETPNLSSFDRGKLQELRNTLNGFKTRKEQTKYIQKWRSFKENKDWDYKVLRIEKHIDIDPLDLKSLQYNVYYKKHYSNMDRYFNMDKEEKKKKSKEKLEEQNKLNKKAKEDRKTADKAKEKAEKAKKLAEEAADEARKAERAAEMAENSKDEGTEDTEDSSEEIKGFNDSDLDNKVQKDDDLTQRFVERVRREKNKSKSGPADKANELRKKAEEAKKKAEQAAELAEKASQAAQTAETAAAASEAAAASAAGSAAAGAGGGVAAAAEPILIAVVIILSIIIILNVVIYAIGGLNAMVGHTPFATCDKVSMSQDLNLNDSRFVKTITRNGIKISMPANVWYYGNENSEGLLSIFPEEAYINTRNLDSAEDRVLTKCYAPNGERGNGVFFVEDLVGMKFEDDSDMPTDGENTWSINMRWEYAYQYIASKDYWVNEAGDLNCTYKDQILAASDAGYKFVPNSGDYLKELLNLKVLVVNPVNGKACICYIGDGHSMANWGPGLSNRLGGLSQTAISYLEYNPANTTDYLNCYFIDVDDQESIPVGPYTGVSLSYGDGCNGSTLNVIDTTSAANAASSLSWGGYLGEGIKNQAYGSVGVSGYREFLYANLLEWEADYQGCCASFVGSILVSQGMLKYEDDVGNQYSGFCGCNAIHAYFVDHPDEWEEVFPTSIDDIMPGDVLMYWRPTSATGGNYRNGRDCAHIAIVGAGGEKYGASGGWYEVCQASREFEGADPGPASNATSYAAWSRKCYEVQTVDSLGRNVSYWRFIGTGN